MRSSTKITPGGVGNRIPHDSLLASRAPDLQPSPARDAFLIYGNHILPGAFHDEFHQFDASEPNLKIGKAPVKRARSFPRLRSGGRAKADVPGVSWMPSWMFPQGLDKSKRYPEPRRVKIDPAHQDKPTVGVPLVPGFPLFPYVPVLPHK